MAPRPRLRIVSIVLVVAGLSAACGDVTIIETPADALPADAEASGGSGGGGPAGGGAPPVDAGLEPGDLAPLEPPSPPPAVPSGTPDDRWAIDDAEWPDPSLDQVFDPGDEPPGTPYALLPPGWDAAAEARWSADNVPKSILTLGDSISESQAFIAEARWDADSGVAAVDGYVHLPKALGAGAGQESSWGASIVEQALAEGRPETATILFGTNDARHGYDLAVYTQNMRTIVEACLAHGTLPILLTQPPLEGDVGPVAELSDTVGRLALEYQVPLFDLQRFLVDRGRLALDLPDGIHPSAEAYTALTTEWIRLYKYVEWRVLAAQRYRAQPPDRFAADRALLWERVFDRTFDRPADADDLEIVRGRWEVVAGADTSALGGRARPDDSAIVRLPVRVAGPVRLEIIAASDGAEISTIAHNAGDPWGTDGWYFGWGTNAGARTGIVYHDGLVAELAGVRPDAGRWAHMRVGHLLHLARWGADFEYHLTYPTVDEFLTPANDRVGFYTYGGQMYVKRVVVWAGRAP